MLLALLAFLFAAIAVLALAVPLWASALIVGGVLLLIAALLALLGLRSVQEGRSADAGCRDRRGQGDRRGHQGGAHRVTSETERKRAEAQAARERLVGTVSELGTAVNDAKQRLRERAVAAVPYVAGGVGLITVLKVLRRKR